MQSSRETMSYEMLVKMKERASNCGALWDLLFEILFQGGL